MMDRVTAYPGALIAETDPLKIQQNTMVALAYTAQAFLGTPTAVDGFGLAPTTPASLVANLSPGAVYQLENLEATAWSSLPANTASSIIKQGLMQSVDPITFTPPATTGYSQAFLVEVQYADLDTTPVLLPYYNATTPSQPYSGPGGSGSSQNTARLGIVAVQVKAGVAVNGTPAIPTPDAGWSGLYIVTLAAGATTVTVGNIATYAGAPFIPVKLPGVPLGVQAGQWVAFVAAGTSTTYTGTLSPVPASLTPRMEVLGAFATANTGTSPTLNLNGLGALPILKQGGGAPAAGDISGFVPLVLNTAGSAWVINGLVASDIVTQITAIAPTFISTAIAAQVGGTAPAASTTAYPNYFADLNAALAWVTRYAITSTGSVTFQCAAGQFVYTASVPFTHPNGSRISIQGAAMTGAVPAKADYVATGNTTAARSSNAATNLTMLRSRFGTELRFQGVGGISIAGNLGSVSNVLLTSDGTVNADLFGITGGIVALSAVVAHGAGNRGFLAAGGGRITATSCGAAACANQNWSFEDGGSLAGYVELDSFGSGGNGINILASSVRMQSGSITVNGNAVAGINSNQGGNIFVGPSAIIAQNSTGVTASSKSQAIVDGANFNTNGTAISATDDSFVSARNTLGSGNTSYSVYADTGSTVAYTGGTISATSGLTPAVNTVGNHNSFIAQ